MKSNIKYWLLSFTLSFFILFLAFVLVFYLVYKKNSDDTEQSSEQNIISEKENPFEDYQNFQDNVGGVSFTEDSITELVRNIYFPDGYLNNLFVDFCNDGSLIFEAKIKDAEKLCELYPELENYKSIIAMIENKKICVKGNVINNDGFADFEIINASVGSFKVDKNIISPFIEDGYFAQLFNIEFDSIEFTEDSVVFKNGVPDILRY